MNRIFLLLPLLLPSLLLVQSLPDDIQNHLKAIPAYAPGDNADPLKKVETYTLQLAPDAPERPALEDGLCAALETATTIHAKTFLGKMLRVAGTERCIPTAEKLLTDPDGNHGARIILAAIPSPAAAEALHRQLNNAKGTAQIGIIQTLGRLRHAPALDDLSDLVDGDTATFALEAIGRIGGNDALDIIMSHLEKADAKNRPTLHHALLRTAETAQDHHAMKAYFWAYLQPEETLMLGGLTGLVRVQPEKAGELLTDAIKSENKRLAATAVSLLSESGDEKTTRQFAAMLTELPPATQLPVIRALASRGDSAAADAVMERLENGDEPVRAAALDAMASLGQGRHVPALLALAVNGKREARTALLRMDGESVDVAIETAIASDNQKQAAEAIRAAAGRNLSSAAPKLIDLAAAENKTVRREAIRALTKLAGPAQRDALVTLTGTAQGSEATGFVRALEGLHKRDPDDAALNAAIGKTMEEAPSASLVPLLAIDPSTANLGKVEALLKQDDMQDIATRTLAGWPTLDAIPVLSDLAANADSNVHRTLALRGYLRLAETSDDSEALYKKAITLAKDTASLKTVLGGLASANTPEALAVVAPYINQPEVRNEAALAAITIAQRLKNTDETKVRDTMASIKTKVEDKNIRNQAQNVLNELDKYKGFIMTWETSGLHNAKGKDSKAIWEASFPPETGKGDWKRLTKGFSDFGCDLGKTYNTPASTATYLRVNVISKTAGPARLELGSDDAVKAWVNGHLVHANYVHRGYGPGQDKVAIELKEGSNPLLLKIVNHGGGWGFCARVRAADGGEFPGLVFNLK